MVACICRIFAAAATPCAWLPEEKATTPPPRFCSGIEDNLLKAPRNLKEPVRCSISGFKKTLVPIRSLSTGADRSGVRTAKGATTAAAASTSAALTGRAEGMWVIRTFYRDARLACKPPPRLRLQSTGGRSPVRPPRPVRRHCEAEPYCRETRGLRPPRCVLRQIRRKPLAEC